MKKNATRRPVVIAHFAITADGKTSTRALTPSRFTSLADKSRLQEVRAGADAILAGARTVLTDSMSMGLSRADLCKERELRGLPSAPLRVVVSNSGRLDPGGKVFQYSKSPLIIFSTRRMPLRLRAEIMHKAELFLFPGGNIDLSAALDVLAADFGVKRVVCEGGGRLVRSLAALDLIDGLYLTIAPVVFGGRQAPTLTGIPRQLGFSTRNFEIVSHSVSGGECFVEFRRQRSSWCRA